MGYMDRKHLIRKALIKSIPVMAAYVVLGTGFGILMSDKGYGPVWSILCSLLIYAGSMQYVGVDLLVTAASPLSTALMTLMVNARHLFYGISMIGRYKNMGRIKPYLIFALTDESYSLLCNEQPFASDEDAQLYYFFVSLFDQSYWVLGTALGALIGSVLSFNSAGIDFSMTALFVTVFVEQWLTVKDHRPALTGLGASVVCLLLFDSSSFLIPAMLLITVLLSVPYAKRGGKDA